MKKLLFLLLSTVSIYGQVSTGQEQEFDYGIKNNSAQTVTTANHLTTTGADGTQGKILPSSLPISTAVANALDLKVENSAGAIQGFAINDNGNGTVNIATGTAYLRTTNDPYAPLIKFVIPAVTNLALTDNANNFVLVDYNSGTPALTVSVSPGTVNTMTNSIAYVISRVGNTLDYINLVGQNVDANGKLRRRFLNSEGLKRASGAVLSGLNRNLILTSGLYYSGLIEVPTPAFNTSTIGTFTQAYLNGGTWVRTTGNTQINNTQYSLSGVLTTMPSNDYRVDYVYLLADNPSKLYVLLGNTTYNNIGSARLAPVPSDLPSELQFLGTRVGRIIIQKDATTMEVSSEFATIYQAGSAQLHNDLGGLNSGDFQHLTVAEKANLTPLASPSFTGTPTAPTATAGTNTTQIATTAFVTNADSNNVKLTGLQVIAGVKLFSDYIQFTTDTGITSGGSFPTLSRSGNHMSVMSATPSGLARLNTQSINTSTPRTFTFPNQDGIFALTNNPTSITATSFVNSSAPATNALLANGSTLANPISGTGTTNFLPKFGVGGVLGNSIVFDNGTNVGIGTTSPATKLAIELNDSSNTPISSFINNNTNAGGIVLVGQNTSTKNTFLGYYGSGLAPFRSLTPNTAFLGGGSEASKIAINSIGTQPITFNTQDWNERARISPDGNLLINTMTDNGLDKLQVNGSTSISSLAGTGTRTVVASSNGQLSTLPNSNARSVRFELSADVNLPVSTTGSVSVVDFDSSVFNIDNTLFTNNGSGVITCTQAGIYLVTTSLVIESPLATALTKTEIGIRKNGTTILCATTDDSTLALGNNIRSLTTTTIINLNANDTLATVVNLFGADATGRGVRVPSLFGTTLTQVSNISIQKLER